MSDPTSPAWCGLCHTLHDRPECPGELRATGNERHGWRVHVESAHGVEAYGVLVAPCGDLWRARILTYPNVLWVVPGGTASMKFAGATPQEAEAKAIAFVEAHLRARGLGRRDGVEPVLSGKIVVEAAGTGAYAKDSGPARRKPRTLPLRYGPLRPSAPGWTMNLSRDGLFVATPSPLEPAGPVAITLDLMGYNVRLRGKVVWRRAEIEPGRPLGMGVRLIAPPQAYTSFYQSLP